MADDGLDKATFNEIQLLMFIRLFSRGCEWPLAMALI